MNIFTPDIAGSDWYSWGMYYTFMFGLFVAAMVIVGGVIRWIIGVFSKRDADTDDTWSHGLGEDDDAANVIGLLIVFAICVLAWPLFWLGAVILVAWLFAGLRPRNKA